MEELNNIQQTINDLKNGGSLMSVDLSIDKTSATYLGVSIGAAIFLGILLAVAAFYGLLALKE